MWTKKCSRCSKPTSPKVSPDLLDFTKPNVCLTSRNRLADGMQARVDACSLDWELAPGPEGDGDTSELDLWASRVWGADGARASLVLGADIVGPGDLARVSARAPCLPFFSAGLRSNARWTSFQYTSVAARICAHCCCRYGSHSAGSHCRHGSERRDLGTVPLGVQ